MVLSLKAHLLKLPLLHLLFYLLPTALSSSITITTTTTTTTIDVNQYLNVQEAIEGTKFQPSSKVDHEEFSRKTRVSDHEWKLNLLHRDAISMSEASVQNLSSTHRHRVDERLERDVKRVTSLTRRVTRAAGAATKNGGGHKISDDGQVVEDFGSQVVSGMDQGSGEYFARIGVGSPPRDQYMVIDTGSDIMWVQCQPCSQCYIQSDPVFNPSDSATFAGVSCRSTVCERLDNSAGCHAGKCRYEVSYGDGSFTKGTVALETLTLGQTVVRNVAIGCGHMNRGMFTGAAGLMGLGGGTMSFVGQLRAQTGGSFGYCLVSRGTNSYGSLVFGRGVIQAGAIWVPLLHNPWAPSLYYVDLMGLGVGDTLLPITKDLFRLSELGDGGVVMDTGTAVTRLPVPAYEMLRDYFISGTAGIPRASEVSIFDTCYDLFGFETVKVPTVSFYFSGGPILTLPARNILIPVDEVGTFCFAFAPTSSGLSIIGNIQQEGIQISIDGANGLLGFGPSTC